MCLNLPVTRLLVQCIYIYIYIYIYISLGLNELNMSQNRNGELGMAIKSSVVNTLRPRE